RRLEQIMLLEANGLADVLDRAPAVRAFLEPFDRLLDAQATLHFELTVDAAARPIDAGRRNVSAEDVDRPSLPLLRFLDEEHGQRIGLLARRAAGRPDLQALDVLPPLL